MKEDITFERALERLEEIVGILEAGSISLEESIRVYQEGIGLSRLCSGMLEAAEGKVLAIMNKSDEKAEEFNLNQFKEA